MSSISPTNLAERYAFLQAELARLEHAYYVLDNPLLPDIEYDKLYRELNRRRESLKRELDSQLASL